MTLSSVCKQGSERAMSTALIDATQLADLGSNCIIVDCRFSLADPALGWQQYQQNHIPGAFFLDLERHLSGAVTANTGRHPLPPIDDFENTLRAIGVTPSSQIVAYDECMGAFAARLWWLCRWLGHKRVAVLDGGLQAWQRLGLALETKANELASVHGTFSAKPNPAMVIDADTLQLDLANASIRLIDARTEERFEGAVEPIDSVAGHIPGALNLPFEDNLDPDGHFHFLPRDILTERHDGTRNTVHMCGSGVTACHNILASVHAGLAMPRLYPGSWSEWIRDPGRATERQTA